jgi:hypothetical protein
MKVKWLLPILVLFVSCQNKRYEKREDLQGLSEGEIVEKLGSPLREKIILVHKNSTFKEYQSNLFRLQDTLKHTDTIRVKEMFWEYKKKKQVVWFIKQKKEWKEYDNLIWSEDINF